jgi:hypothetical protein
MLCLRKNKVLLWANTIRMRLDAVERACYNPPAQKTEYCGVEQWQLVGLITQRSLVRIQAPLPNRTHPEPCMVVVEQFLAMLRFEQRGKLAELLFDIMQERSG